MAGFDGMPVEATILDAEGTILLVNEAWRRFGEQNHDTHPDHWVDENYFEVCRRAYAEPRASEILDGLQEILSGENDRFRAEYPCHSPEEQRWFMIDAAGFDFEGEPHLFVCHFDITERKLTQRQAAARAKQLESIIHVLSHDVRNPLQAIYGYVDLVAADLDSTDDIERIRSAAERISEITEATLAFSRVSEPSRVESLTLGSLASDAWQCVSTGEATLTVASSGRLHGDRELLFQLFENLFRNAVDHAGPDCSVTVGTLDGGFYVEDDGPGIPIDLREKVLRADFSTRGTGGIGLAIVQAVVDAHGGTLRVTDGVDGGARFEVTGLDMAPAETGGSIAGESAKR